LLADLAPFIPTLLIISSFVVFSSIIGLAGPWLLGKAIDEAINGRTFALLIQIASLMAVVYLLSNGANYIANRLMARISQQALKNLRADLFDHLQRLPIAFFDTHPSGSLMSRLTNDIEAINQTVSQNIISLLASTLTMIGILASMFILNPWLALCSFAVIPLMYWFTAFIARYTRKGFRELQKDLAELNAVSEETITGFKVISAFQRNDAAIDMFKKRNEAVCASAIRANSYAMLLMPLTGVLGSFFVIVLASAGGWLALKGLVSIGTIAAFINYAQNFTSPLRQISNLYNTIQAALAGAERVFEILDLPGELQTVETSPSPRGSESSWSLASFRGHVRFSHVMFGYTPDRLVIKNFNLDIAAGSTVAIVGPTGAGKTTLTNLLTRFYDINSGSIFFDGIDITTIPRAEVRRATGLVLQDTFLFADTVLENIRFGRLDATDEECIEAARLAEADHFIRQLPMGYSTVLSERAGNLSQGQRQLLSIARAILGNPRILILDEATSSVDTRTEMRIQKALLRLMRGRTSIIIAHRLSTIRDADCIVVINEGEIVEQGTHLELMERRGFYHRLYMSQFKGNDI
ncbi:MAG: ABC transporter ATP-binding protein/permease, partial [Rectinema sp.]|nr:ABC transporter ATP-binding protein/permease [Rectinema sp.]